MLIPVLTVRDMPEAIAFYTRLLDFRLRFAWPEQSPIYVGLTRSQDELHLSLTPGHRRYGHCSAMLLCDDVDILFAEFRARGLPPSTKPDSPVHDGPLDQTWGTREVYIDDPSGNTLILQQR